MAAANRAFVIRHSLDFLQASGSELARYSLDRCNFDSLATSNLSSTRTSMAPEWSAVSTLTIRTTALAR